MTLCCAELVIKYTMRTPRQGNKTFLGCLEVVTCILHHCHRNCMNLVCENGQLLITKYLITELQCKPLTVDSGGRTLLPYACRYGHAAKPCPVYLISELNCHPSTVSNGGRKPLRLSETTFIILSAVYWKSGPSITAL